jgi:hypothetical protein
MNAQEPLKKAAKLELKISKKKEKPKKQKKEPIEIKRKQM